MYQGLLIAGFGGQGVVSAGILATYAGMLEGKNVTFFPSYGAEMRGGTANCSVVISTDEVSNPIVSSPTSLIVMNEPSLTTFESTVHHGGVLFINNSLVKTKPKRSDIQIVSIPANELAEKAGNIKCANMVMLGAFCKKTGSISVDSVINALPKIFKKAKKEMMDINIATIRKGFEAC